MAVVLTELLQNAVDHAFPEPSPTADARRATVRVELANDGGELVVRVVDDGVGLPEEFSVDTATGLGLSIVRALVTSDLRGTIDMFEPARRQPRHGRRAAAADRPRRRRVNRRRTRSDLPLGEAVRGAERSGGAALAGDVLLAQLAALLLGGAAPDAGVLVGGEGELEAGALGVALAADGLGVLDLLDGRAGGADREEEVGIGVAARGVAAPLVRFEGERQQVGGTSGPRVPPGR